jgi:nucleotide-binding universal stress UspA family protein
MFKHILLPTDGSSISETAIQSGIRFAKEINAKVTGLCVVPKGYYAIYEGEIPGVFQEKALAECKAQAENKLSQIAKTAEQAGVSCETVLETSDQPYESIIKVADQKGCDLIMMASHGRHGMEALLLGSETQKVLTHSKIPVLVYR